MAIEIPTDAQQILDANDPRFQGATATPEIPGTSLPPAPPTAQNPPQPPGIGSSIAPGSLADKISAAFLEHLSKNQPTPVVQSKKPSVGQNIMGVANGVAAGLSDASHANDVKGGGWLTGVTSTLASRQQRLSGERQQQFQNAEQKRKDDALIATNQAQTVSAQRNIYRQDSELRQNSYKQGAAFTESMRDKHDIQDGISHNELTSLVKKDPSILQSHYAKQTSEEAVYDADGKPQLDPSGNPVMSPVYSLIARATKDGSPNTHKVTQDDHDFILKNTGQDIPVNTNYPFDSWMSTNTTALANHNTVAMMNKARSEDMTAEQQRQVQTELADSGVQHAIAAVPGKPLQGLYQFQQNADQHLAVINAQVQAAQGKGDQAAIQQLQQQAQQIQEERAKITHVVDFGFSTKDKDDFAKQAETERHNQAEEANKTAELAQKKAESNFVNPPGSAGLTGGAYLKTLPQPQQLLLTSIAEGRNVTAAIQNRKGELTPVGQALIQAYPDFDITKAKDYQKVRTDFTSGATSKALTAYGTAINHARALYDTTDTASYIPGTDQYKRYNQDITYVATEVAKALNPTGVATESAIKEQESALRSTFNRKAAIENAEHILTGKMAETKQRWTNAQVRPSYQPPMPGLSQEAMDNADYIRNHGQAAQPQLPPAVVQQLKEGQTTTFANGQSWTLRNGQPVQTQGVK